MKRTVAIVTLLFTSSLMVFAHGKGKHVMGTVTDISENSITSERPVRLRPGQQDEPPSTVCTTGLGARHERSE